MRFAPQAYQRTFGAAHWALILALALPLTVMLFGLVRARQFKTRLDSKWAKSSPLATFQVEPDQPDDCAAPDDVDHMPEHIRIESSSALDSAEQPSIDRSHTGSATAEHFTKKAAVANKRDFDDSDLEEQESKSSMQRTAMLTALREQDDTNQDLLEATERIEAQVKQVHQSVDQLARKLNEHHAEAAQQQTKILDWQQQLVDQGSKLGSVLEKLEETTTSGFVELRQDISNRNHSSNGFFLNHAHCHEEPKPSSANVPDSEDHPEPVSNPPATFKVQARPDLEPVTEQLVATNDSDDQFFEPIRVHVENQTREVNQQDFMPSSQKHQVAKQEPGPKSQVAELKADADVEAANEPVEPLKLLDEYVSTDGSIRIRRESVRDAVEQYSMDVEDADLREFLEKLGEVAHIGILPSPLVDGRISLHLQKRRLDNVLQAIAKSRNYVVEREHGMVIIRTCDEVQKSKKRKVRTAARPAAMK